MGEVKKRLQRQPEGEKTAVSEVEELALRKLRADVADREARAMKLELDNRARASILVLAATAREESVRLLSGILDGMMADLDDLAAGLDGPVGVRRAALGQWLRGHLARLESQLRESADA